MRNILHKILYIFLLWASVLQAGAKGFSYVYIQGDKTTPFYVKFEDQMLPRYGKDYNIIPQLAPGPINIQVLFQQNAYPPQKFTIVVPENGFRGFLLLKKGESFALYDIHQQFYLQPGNKALDDKAPAANSADAYVYTNTHSEVAQPVIKSPAARPRPGTNTPRFLNNIELNNERTVQDNPAVVVQEETEDSGDQPEEQSYTNDFVEPEVNTEPPREAVRVANSDCPSALDDRSFEDLYGKVRDKSEKMKLKFMLGKMADCYTSNQVRILTETLTNDPEKYTFLKRVYPRVTDQYNFPPLEKLLSTEEWKSYFKLILPK